MQSPEPPNFEISLHTTVERLAFGVVGSSSTRIVKFLSTNWRSTGLQCLGLNLGLEW